MAAPIWRWSKCRCGRNGGVPFGGGEKWRRPNGSGEMAACPIGGTTDIQNKTTKTDVIYFINGNGNGNGDETEVFLLGGVTAVATLDDADVRDHL